MEDWITKLDGITEQAVSHFGALTIEQLNWRPNATSWSIGQCIDHLIRVNESYYPILSSLSVGTYKTPFMANFGWIVSFFGKMLLNAVQPDRQRKMKTFPIWEPSESKVDGDLLKRFENHQLELKRKIDEAKGLVGKGVIISSPANRTIVYKLETAFDIIVSHEQRHLEQAKEVLSMLEHHAN